jgi:hypothetical protein
MMGGNIFYADGASGKLLKLIFIIVQTPTVYNEISSH